MNSVGPIQPIDPARRLKAIQNAIAKRKIKRNHITDEILVLLSQMVEEKQSA